MARGFVVTALEVKVTEERLDDEGCDDGHPGFDKIDESSVGAELLQDVDWELALKVPGCSRLPIGKEDCPPAIVHGAIILWIPVLLSGTQSAFSRKVVGVRVDIDDGEPGMRIGWLLERVQRGMVAVGPGIDGLERRPAHLAEESACEEIAFACHTAGLLWLVAL